MNPYRIFKIAIDKNQSANRHECEQQAIKTLLKEAFGYDEEAQLEIGHDLNGAPYLKSKQDTHISISHSIDTCVLAVSDKPIGVDIETARQQLKRVASKFLTAEEHQRFSAITAEDASMAFLLKAWTAKESVFKAALIPDLVLSEINLDADFTTAEARGRKFELSYRHLSHNSTIAAAMEASES